MLPSQYGLITDSPRMGFFSNYAPTMHLSTDDLIICRLYSGRTNEREEKPGLKVARGRPD